MRAIVGIVLVLSSAPLVAGVAQQGPALNRAQAIAAALSRNPRLAAARADSAAAAARITTAGALPNPTFAASYSKSTPQYHFTAEMPFDQLWLRGTRVAAAEAGQLSARYRLRYQIASVSLDVDTTYTRALAAVAHSRLSTRNAQDADSLRRIAIARRDAGDASDLDVELVTLTAGQQANAAAADSVTAQATLLELQALIGTVNEGSGVTLTDSLDVSTDIGVAAMPPPPADAPLLVASGAALVQAATLNARVQHRNVFGSPGVVVGFETGDPTGAEPGLLPTVGIALPLPIFNRNRGPIAEAEAERAHAVAELNVARIESQLQLSRTRSALVATAGRLTRDRQLLQSATRVQTMSLAAYREGASPLTSVLEAQRIARDVQGQYVDDAANALIAAATLRLLTLTPASATP
jgi:outer membrane protein, heavy metal efflux system